MRLGIRNPILRLLSIKNASKNDTRHGYKRTPTIETSILETVARVLYELEIQSGYQVKQIHFFFTEKESLRNKVDIQKIDSARVVQE